MSDDKKSLNESYNGQKSDRGLKPRTDNGQRPEQKLKPMQPPKKPKP